MSPTTAHLEALNGPQRRAVTYGEPVLPKGFRSGPLLIVAGAGTGKTSTLAARVAQAAGASGVILLSDVDGLYDRNPKEAGATLIGEVNKIDANVRAMVAGGSSSGMGSGGMASKLDAADIATRAGIGLAIASGLRDHPLAALDKGVGATWFVPQLTARARKS